MTHSYAKCMQPMWSLRTYADIYNHKLRRDAGILNNPDTQTFFPRATSLMCLNWRSSG